MHGPMLKLFIKAFIWAAIAAPLSLVRAQTTNATCLATWDWAVNSRQQSPCQVAAYLLAPCANGQWNVPALQSGQYYTPPTVAGANQCACSTVVYQLMSACGKCQGQQIVTWSTWRGQCADGVTSVASYPRSIPGATSVPAWAYINILGTDVFDASIAQAAAQQPESSASGSTSASATSTSTPPVSSSPSSVSNSPASSSSSPAPTDTGGSSNNIGAIVGGTVGGVVGIGLIICLAIFLTKRQSNKAKMPPSAEFSKVIPPGSPVPASFDPAAVGFRSRTTSPMSNGLNSDYGHGHSMHQIGMNGHNNGPVAYGGSPWSPPPMGHTPAPSGVAFSSAYTPPPPGMGTGNQYTYTPPPGTIGSDSSFQQQYTHSHSNSGVTGYNPTPVSQNMNRNPYGGHASNSSYSGAPEL